MDIPKQVAENWSHYQALQNSGLKKQANKALNEIVSQLEGKDDADIKGFLFSLCDKGLNPNVEYKIQYPLFVKCIIPLLLNGYKRNSVKELLYIVKAMKYGYWKEIYEYFGDISPRNLLKKALELDTNNVEVLSELMAEYISELEYGAHHLPDTIVLDLAYINQTISECSAFILKNRKHIDPQALDVFKYYSRLCRDYSEWTRETNELDFLAWCIQHDKKYHWVNSDYV